MPKDSGCGAGIAPFELQEDLRPKLVDSGTGPPFVRDALLRVGASVDVKPIPVAARGTTLCNAFHADSPARTRNDCPWSSTQGSLLRMAVVEAFYGRFRISSSTVDHQISLWDGADGAFIAHFRIRASKGKRKWPDRRSRLQATCNQHFDIAVWELDGLMQHLLRKMLFV